MKYWWLEKYQSLEVKMLPELWDDIRYFIVMPKNYSSWYEKIKNISIDELTEIELLILLYGIVSTKNVKDNKLRLIIKKLLEFPNTSLPITDYSLKEILEEVRDLKKNIAIPDKLDCNNIAACYHCLHLFYVDQIKQVNRKGHCLCPYCLHSTLYFDNDYIPMHYSFLKLSQLYYGISSLGSKFSDIQRILKRGIHLQLGNSISTDTVICFSKFKTSKHQILLKETMFDKKKISSQMEEKVIKDIYDSCMVLEKQLVNETTIFIRKLPSELNHHYSFLLILALMDVLSRTIYLKDITILCEDLSFYQALQSVYKTISRFSLEV